MEWSDSDPASRTDDACTDTTSLEPYDNTIIESLRVRSWTCEAVAHGLLSGFNA